MISEPELDGEWESERPAEEVRPVAARGPGAARPWLWALGGAVLASAVWAGTLSLQDRFFDAPRIAYRHSEDLCAQAPLKVIGGMAGEFEEGLPRHSKSPALDWSYCSYNTLRTTGRASYYGQVLVELHKKTDPAPEFGNGPGLHGVMEVQPVNVQKVPGLGEQALVSGLVRSPQLQVLDGGAVFTITVQWWGEDGDDETDVDALKAAMIEDMRTLMAAVKK
ncbi:hypothetical protein ACIPUC_21050 [Streptomyces sp. LARHCF249]